MVKTEAGVIVSETAQRVCQYQGEHKSFLLNSSLRENFIWHDIDSTYTDIISLGLEIKQHGNELEQLRRFWKKAPGNIPFTKARLSWQRLVCADARDNIQQEFLEGSKDKRTNADLIVKEYDKSDLQRMLVKIDLFPVFANSVLFLNHPNEERFGHLIECKTDLQTIMVAVGLKQENLVGGIWDKSLVLNGAQAIIFFNLLNNAYRVHNNYLKSTAGKGDETPMTVSLDDSGIKIANLSENAFDRTLIPQQIFPIQPGSGGRTHCGIAIAQVYARTIGAELSYRNLSSNKGNHVETNIIFWK